jgi:ammonia channel protein AmtB
LNIHDTRGVFSLHALPAIVGALASVVLLFVAPITPHGQRIRNIYPFMKTDTVDGRNAGEQALFQLGGLGITLIIAVVSGLITGI